MENPPPYQPGEPEANSVDESRAKTGLGLDANLGAALGYPIGIVAIIIFIMEKTNRFARFHALQSILYHVLAVVVFVVLSILITVLTMVLAAINDSLGCVGILLWLVFLVVG